MIHRRFFTLRKTPPRILTIDKLLQIKKAEDTLSAVIDSINYQCTRPYLSYKLKQIGVTVMSLKKRGAANQFIMKAATTSHI